MAKPLTAFRARYGARAATVRRWLEALRPRGAARLGRRPRHRDLRRQLGPRVPERHEGRAAAARLAASPARRRRAPSTCGTAGTGWDERRRARASTRRGPVRRRPARDRAGARRRQLAAARLRRRLGAARWRQRGVGAGAAAAVQLRLRRRPAGPRARLERLPARAPRRRSRSSRWRWPSRRATAARPSTPGRVRAHRHRHRGQPGLCALGARCATRSPPTAQATVAARPAARAHRRQVPARSGASARRRVARHATSRAGSGIEGAKAALLHEVLGREALRTTRPAWPQALKALPLRLAAPRPVDGGDQQRGRRAAGVARRAPDAARAARRVLRRRDARLGGADRRLPAHRLLRQRAGGRAGGGRLAARGGEHRPGVAPPCMAR